MTKEERDKVIKVMKWLHDNDFLFKSTEEDVKYATKLVIQTLEQEPKTDIALARYKDLQDYFGDEAIAKTILENQTEFKAWLERLRWNTIKVNELARKLKALEQEQCDDAISQEFLELVVQYPPKDLCSYPEYRDKPYYSIKYYENGECHVGYGTYNLEVLSRFLKDYFITPVNPQEKTGHWIYKQYGGYPEQGNYHCSECDKIDNRIPAYCPNCCCRMDGRRLHTKDTL